MNTNSLFTRIFLILLVISGLAILIMSINGVNYTVDRVDNLKLVKFQEDNIFMQNYKIECNKEINALQTQLAVGGVLTLIFTLSCIIIFATKKGRIIYKDRIKIIPEELICWIFAFTIWSYTLIQPFNKKYSMFWVIVLLAITLTLGMKILTVRNNKKVIISKNKMVRQINNNITAINTTILIVTIITTYFVYKEYKDASLLINIIAGILVLIIALFAYILDKDVDKNTKSLLGLSNEYTKYSLVVLNTQESYQRRTNTPVVITIENGLEAVYNKDTNDFMFYLMPLKEDLVDNSIYYEQMEINKSNHSAMNINIKKYLYGFTSVYQKREADEKNIKNDKLNLRTALWFLDEGWGSHKKLKGDRWLDLKDKNKFYVEWCINIGDEHKKFFIDVDTLRVVRVSDSQLIEDYNNGIKQDKEYNEKLIKRINARLKTVGINYDNIYMMVDQLGD